MSGRLRRAFVLAIVVGLVAQSAVAPALAAGSSTTTASTSTTPECEAKSTGDTVADLFLGPVDEGASLAGDVLDGGNWIEDGADCYDKSQVQNATHGQIYQSATVSSDVQRRINASFSNHLQDTQTVARTIIEREFVEGIKANLTEQQISDNINHSLQEYFTTRQANFIKAHNTSMMNLWYQFKRSETVGTTTSLFYVKGGDADPADNDTQYIPYDGSGNTWTNNSSASAATPAFYTSEESVQLLNGNNTNAVVILQKYRYDDTNPTYAFDPFNASGVVGGWQYEFQNFGHAIVASKPQYEGGVNLNSPSRPNVTVAYNEWVWHEKWQSIEYEYDQAIANGQRVVNASYDQYADGTLDIDNFADANTLATQYASKENETGYYAWARAKLGTLGISHDINSSTIIEYTPSSNSSINGSRAQFVAGQTYTLEGGILTNWKPAKTNGKIVNGTTYNTSNTDLPVYFASQEENGSVLVGLEGEFTITSLTNVRTGETLTQTTLDDRTQERYNNTINETELQGLIDYNQDQLDTHSSSSTGGGSTTISSGGLLDDLRNWFDTALTGAWIGIIALAGVGLLMLRILSG
jgi:hypothetical protein